MFFLFWTGAEGGGGAVATDLTPTDGENFPFDLSQFFATLGKENRFKPSYESVTTRTVVLSGFLPPELQQHSTIGSEHIQPSADPFLSCFVGVRRGSRTARVIFPRRPTFYPGAAVHS